MRLLRAILRSRKGQVLTAGVAIYIAWQIWLTIAAPAKIDTALARGGERLNIMVTLPFPPERFHVQTFQGFGRVSGTEDNKIEVRGVKREDLTRVARLYWVTRIEPLQQGGK